MRFLAIFLLPVILFAEDLEVRLATKTPLVPIYLSTFHSDDYDWRKYEDLRETLETDLNQSGIANVIKREQEWEDSLKFPEKRNRFDTSFWKKAQIPFCLRAHVVQNRLEIYAFNIEQGTSKKYPPIPLERRAIHQLADTIQKDLFGQDGIASLRIIYTKRAKNPNKGLEFLSELWMCDSDGKNAIQLTKNNSYCMSPHFLPHSATDFFYTSEKSGQSKIYLASLSDPEGKLMVDLRGNQALAAMKANHLAFITDVAGRPDLFIQNFDASGKTIGKARQLFSAPRATQASPTFSPDGKRIAFVSDKDGPPRIYVLNVVDAKSTKKQNPQLITKRNRENTSPSWSPDGTKLAYSAKVDGVRQIWVYDFLTNEESQLTVGPENKENPDWAPDNFHLVYNTESEEQCDLYIIDINQKDPIQIGPGRFASWQQRP